MCVTVSHLLGVKRGIPEIISPQLWMWTQNWSYYNSVWFLQQKRDNVDNKLGLIGYRWSWIGKCCGSPSGFSCGQWQIDGYVGLHVITSRRDPNWVGTFDYSITSTSYIVYRLASSFFFAAIISHILILHVTCRFWVIFSEYVIISWWLQIKAPFGGFLS